MTEPIRRETRYPAALPIRVGCAAWREFIDFYTVNISAGGLFVGTETPLAVDSVIDVQITLPESHGSINLPAKIVHARSVAQAHAEGKPAGMGIQFDPLTMDQQRYLYALLDIARIAVGTGAHPMTRPPAPPASPPAPPAHGRRVSASPAIDDPDFFGPITEGFTGKTSISREVALAAAMRLINDSDYAGAKQELQALFATAPQDVKGRVCWLLAEARELKGTGQLTEAQAKYQQMLQLDETHTEAIAEVRAFYASQRQSVIGKIFGAR